MPPRNRPRSAPSSPAPPAPPRPGAPRAAAPRSPGLPAYGVTPQASSCLLHPGYYGAHYVGRAYDPFETGSDPNSPNFKIQNLVLPGGMTIERLDERRRLRQSLDNLRRDIEDSGNFDAMDRFEQQAYELVTGPAVSKAFNLAAEDEKLRDRYGRNTWGQSALLARRLVEAGSSSLRLHIGGWDATALPKAPR